jgi:protein-S-isoprenylcysteine O-methyltransferase Ste14
MSSLTGWFRGRPSTTESTAALWTTALLDAVVFFAIFMVALPWGAHRLLSQTLPVPAPIGTWAGAGLFTAGICVLIACLDTFVRRGRGTPLPAEAPRHLVTDGLFGIVRNPIIVAEAMVIWGEALYVASLGLVLYALAFSVAGHLVVLYVEEPELRRRFGESYEAYVRSVPRWLPRLRAKRA